MVLGDIFLGLFSELTVWWLIVLRWVTLVVCSDNDDPNAGLLRWSVIVLFGDTKLIGVARFA